ncbi:MAG TPA: type II toxin-antitoxin system HicA family toxin [Longimicrobium sp.]|nr:type II toxin-antitoxin system HicA family toxin [Longimicrobium sp.]
MKLPRDLNGRELADALGTLGYRVVRQTGSHIRLTTHENGEHHVVVPDHRPLKIGTLSAILSSVERHFEISRNELLKRLFQ